jgi:hypothetical protein
VTKKVPPAPSRWVGACGHGVGGEDMAGTVEKLED